MPINGLTNVPKAFLRLGHIRKGIKDPKTGYPKDLDYFRVTFKNQPECEEEFRKAYGEKPTAINIRLAFPTVSEVWDANYECYSKGGMIAMAGSTDAGDYWIFYRRHDDGVVLVRNGRPVGQEGLDFIEKPIDIDAPIYSYKNAKDQNVNVILEPTGRLNVVVPEISHIRVGFLEFRAGSIKDIAAISRELAAIDHFARLASKDITGIPMVLTRQPEEITRNIGGKLSRGESWMVHIEVSGGWGSRALDVMAQEALPELIDAEAVDVEEDEVFIDQEPVQEVVPEPAQELEPEEPPIANEPITRPYDPVNFKEHFENMVVVMTANYKMQKAEIVIEARDRKVLASAIDTIFNGKKTKRYEFCKWLIGESSTKKMQPVHVKCLLKIMGIADFSQAPSEDSIKEINSGHSEALRSMGQEELIKKEE